MRLPFRPLELESSWTIDAVGPTSLRRAPANSQHTRVKFTNEVETN